MAQRTLGWLLLAFCVVNAQAQFSGNGPLGPTNGFWYWGTNVSGVQGRGMLNTNFLNSVSKAGDTLTGIYSGGRFTNVAVFTTNLVAPNLSATTSAGVALTDPTVSGTLGLNGDFVTGLYTNQGTNVGGVFTNVALFATNINGPNLSANASEVEITNGVFTTARFVNGFTNVGGSVNLGTNNTVAISGGSGGFSAAFFNSVNGVAVDGNGFTTRDVLNGGVFRWNAGTFIRQGAVAGTIYLQTNLVALGFITPTNGIQWTAGIGFAWPASTAGIYATNVSSTIEVVAVDSGGTHTQITQDSWDGPAVLYDTDTNLWPYVTKTWNVYTGLIRWENRNTGQKVVETFEQYQARTGRAIAERKVWQVEQDAKQAAYDAERAAKLIERSTNVTVVVPPAVDIRVAEPAHIKRIREAAAK